MGPKIVFVDLKHCLPNHGAVSRPKETPRIRLTIRVLPDTHEAIFSKIDKSKRELNTPGKVTDRAFQPQEKSA